MELTPNSRMAKLRSGSGCRPGRRGPCGAPLSSKVAAALRRLPTRKAIGPDGIAHATAKLAGPSLHEMLSDIFTRAVAAQRVPIAQKGGTQFALHKKSTTAEMDNYRGIVAQGGLQQDLLRHRR